MNTHWDFMARFYGAAWFLLLAIVSVSQQTISISHSIAQCSIVLLYLLFGFMIWIRPVAKSQSRDLLPYLMAFTGTYMPWTISFIPSTDYAWANWFSPMLVIGGMWLAIFSLLHLRTGFSLVPQARTVVRS